MEVRGRSVSFLLLRWVFWWFSFEMVVVFWELGFVFRGCGFWRVLYCSFFEYGIFVVDRVFGEFSSFF